jgi:DNA-binding PadR family transcriptional regulator
MYIIMKKSNKSSNKLFDKSSKKSSKKNSGATKKKIIPAYVELKGFLSFFILHELNEISLSGDDLARRIGERRSSISGLSGVLTPGTIYPALKRLRRQKLVFYRRIGRKKVYSLTLSGKSEIKALYIVFSEFFYGFKNKLKK